MNHRKTEYLFPTIRLSALFLAAFICAEAQSPIPPLDAQWTAQELPHDLGYSDGDGWTAPFLTFGSANFMQYGPYATNAPAGDNIAVWRLQVALGGSSYPIVRLEVYDADSATVLASRDIYRNQWHLPLDYENFMVPFRLNTASVGHRLEYRTWFYNRLSVKEQWVGFANESNNTAGASWNAQAVPHLIGRPDGTGWAANTAQDRPNYLQYGPYSTNTPAGDNAAVWRLLIDNNSADNLPIVRLEVSDYEFNTILGSRDISRQQWAFANVNQDFSVPFTLAPANVGHHLEYRVYWYGRAYVKEQAVSFANENSNLTWNAQSLPHLTGRADGAGWSANTRQDVPDFLQFGPYSNAQPGNNLAIWRLQIDNNTTNNQPVVRLDVNDATTNTILASQDITRGQFSFPFEYDYFSLPFNLDASHSGDQIEYRVYWYGKAYVKEQAVGTK